MFTVLGVLAFFFFNDTATTEIYTFPYTTLFRSPGGPGRRARGPVLAGRPHRRRPRPALRRVRRSGRDPGRGLLRADGDPSVDAEFAHAHERRPPARPAVGLLRAASG